MSSEMLKKWVYVSYAQVHTHDVRALTVAVPISQEGLHVIFYLVLHLSWCFDMHLHHVFNDCFLHVFCCLCLCIMMFLTHSMGVLLIDRFIAR